MSEIFRFCFEQITDPLSLQLDPVAEWIILAVVHEIVYRIAFSKVGMLYRTGIINGRLAGSFLHWLIRTISFIAFWAGINFTIAVYVFIAEYWLTIIGVMGVILFLVACGIIMFRTVCNHRESKPVSE